AGVEAYVYACGSCSPGRQKVAFVMRMTDGYRKLRMHFANDDAAFDLARDEMLERYPEEGVFVSSSAPNAPWHREGSPQALALMDSPSTDCGGPRAFVRCQP